MARLLLDAVTSQANDAVQRAERLTDLRERYRQLVRARTSGVANQLVDLAFELPVLIAPLVERRLEVSRPTALGVLRTLADVGVVTEAADGPRGQLRWRAHEIISVLSAPADTQPSVRFADGNAPATAGPPYAPRTLVDVQGSRA